MKSIYEIGRGHVQLSGEKSEEFYMKKGMKQGYSLNPPFFNILQNRTKAQRKNENCSNLCDKNLQTVKINRLNTAFYGIKVKNTFHYW